MKILLYTISNFANKSIDCIDLLLSSITFDIDVDFAIVSNIKDYKCVKYYVIEDCSPASNDYVGYLKYSENIPKEAYDYIIYLDSDILYFDKISNLIDISKSITITNEYSIIGHNPWFYPNEVVDIKHEKAFIQCVAMNAGTFALHSSKFDLLSEIRKTYEKHKSKRKSVHDLAQLEQSIYNYVVYRENNFNSENMHNITNFVQLHAGSKQKTDDKKLYHFCGFTNNMSSKFNTMKDFYDKYTK